MNNKEYERFYYQKAEGNLFVSGERGAIADFIREHTPSGAVLEVGCGTGEMLNVLPDTIHYTGVDVSSLAIEEAQKRHKRERASFRLLAAGTSALPFPESTFDIVVSVYALEHFRAPKKYLREMVRVLKKGGHLILLAPNLELPTAVPNAIRHTSHRHKALFIGRRLVDYGKRVFGNYSFRTIPENYTEATGLYEKPDDDLTHVVSSFEVIRFLEQHCHLQTMRANQLGKGSGVKHMAKRLTTFLPAMRYFGTVLFVIMRK